MFEQPIKNIRRLREVLQVLFKYGFEDVVIETPLRRLVPEQTRLTWTRRDRSVFEYSREERIRLVIEELGATFIKLAQLLSNRPDLVPEALIAQFERLQNNAPPFSTEVVRKIVEDELGRPIDSVFSFFDDKPLGAASIGQVHRARLISGEEVVVKVQRPDIRDKVEADLDILKILVRRTEGYLASVGLLNPMDIVEAFEKNMQKELDYQHEARSVEQFRTFYQKSEDFVVPRAFRRLTTGKVLVMEFASGCKITDLKRLNEWGLDPKKIAEQGLDIYLRQIFEFGYFHADPHPGNVLVRPDGKIILIDFGAVGKIMQKDKFALASIFFNMARGSARDVAVSLRRLSIEGEIEDMKTLEYDLNEFMEDFAGLEVSEIDVGLLARRLQQIIFLHRIRVHGSVFLILRALAILDGIGKVVHPDFNALEFLKPYGQKLIREQYSIENISFDALHLGGQLLSFVNAFPTDLRTILQKLRKGKILVQVEHHGHQDLLKIVDRLANKLSMALLVGALLMAASFAVDSPHLSREPSTGIPYLSLVELSIAAFFGTLLVLNLMRNGIGHKK